MEGSRTRRKRPRLRNSLDYSSTFGSDESIDGTSSPSVVSQVPRDRSSSYSYHHGMGNYDHHLLDITTLSYHDGLQEPLVLHGCLILPVGLAVWWYWTKRTARKVFRKVMLTSGSSSDPETSPRVSCASANAYHCHEPSNNNTPTAANDDTGLDTSSDTFVIGPIETDQYHSWEDVVFDQEQHPNDQSLRFVRWIRGKDQISLRTRVNMISRRTLRRASTTASSRANHSFGSSSRERESDKRTTPLMDGENNDLEIKDPILSTSNTSTACSSTSENNSLKEPGAPVAEEPSFSSSGTDGRWQCIEDVTGGIELCEHRRPQRNRSGHSDSTGSGLIMTNDEILARSIPDPSASGIYA